MILSDVDIRNFITSNELVIDPINTESIQPASVDCTLGDNFLIADESVTVITTKEPIKYKAVVETKITIPAKCFILATTVEYVKLPLNLSAFVEGRSSIGRMGLFIQNAGWVDPGFEGRITLELYNANNIPIQLESGMRICQLVFSKMETPASKPYCGKYQKQQHTTGSKIFKD